jgi:two-component system CheB/CheR fusion protein
VTRVPVTVQAVVRTAVESASPLIQAARHELTVIGPQETLWIYGDEIRLAQVIGNLLMNAAKYTPRGGRITLTMGREREAVVIRVADNGLGIPADQLHRVFEMFTQVHSKSNAHDGLGVGLAIAKRIVDLHGGSIEAHSPGIGHGTELVVRLPAARPGAATEPRDAAAARPAARPLKILLVDDNADLVQMLDMCISGMGHQVRKALDGRSAIQAALSYRPDVILLDLGLPIVSGLDVARELRRHPEMKDTRLVAMTGWGQDEDRRHTSEAGFDHHLTKPTDPGDLEQLLARFAAEQP